jgi:uncharacterized protein YyaL (SSP411 family)
MTNEHAIKWLDWTNEAFQRARVENKPILLDISAVWCHWCHRLDHDTYSVPEIVEYVESHFIPIRVDTDKRPDINRRYNMGGWPTTAFLTPSGLVMGGGTYFPPDQMRQILRDVYSVWEKSKDTPFPARAPEPDNKPVGEISMSIVDEVLGDIANNFDSIYGGFGSQPKFPNTEAHELVLSKFHHAGNREILKIATLTLQNVGKSRLFDSEMGGFFRYSTVRDWSIPHFEKMSEDNAKWLSLYLHAFQETGEQFYATVAKRILEYVMTWLSDPENGCFYGSQDADEEYYNLTKNERLRVTAPFVDKQIYTNWNALMISSFFEASVVLGEASIRNFAMRSLDRLMSLNYNGEHMCHYDKEPHLPAQLADQMQTARTLCHAYELTGDRKFIRNAENLIRSAVDKLYDREHGGFSDTEIDPNAPGYLSKPTKPLDENSIASRLLVKLHYLTGEEYYHKMAEETLNQFVEVFPQFGLMAADYALAVDAFVSEPTIIRIIGSVEEPQTIELLTESNRIYEPRKIIRVYDPDEDAKNIAELSYSSSNRPTALVCLGRLCGAPIIDPLSIAPELERLRSSQLRR